MKSRYNGMEIVTQLTDADIVDIISTHEFFDSNSYIKAVEGMFCDFECQPISVRDKVIRFILKKHLSKTSLKKMLEVLDSFDMSMWD